MGWEVYPEGLEKFLSQTAEHYTGDLPLIVTENGMASSAPTEDVDRIDYLNKHLDAVQNARGAGAPVASYYVWSLVDNYEWALGYEKRFVLCTWIWKR